MSNYYCHDCDHEWSNDSSVEDDHCPECESEDIEYNEDDDYEGLDGVDE